MKSKKKVDFFWPFLHLCSQFCNMSFLDTRRCLCLDVERPADFQGLYLKKHTSMGRTYTLNKKDSKMVGDAMKKKL